ncbi:hypothetical protein BU24DRAFT_462436 [Aaosphaeria arxii CBS 175.79]|uniref:MIF4G domain-containing protein n=1 Tax=Aaosphaeria arxii CBS 175.79 TaxID=1450172 RepID=A0A6A5XTW7_9PLEO|nr:uncharacterized protein BU24DRAFT_462436 [Aaosphaeria arxii CBS 175.79]KAF2016257.1 hypothetical protein BU24DRAFT_462436 [Aaosphaeria arxii CBS 175.79]
MSASVPNAQTPTIAASQNATAAPAPSTGSSANVAAGTAQPTARSYANATKKVSSPPIASSATPPVAVGGQQNPQHGKRASVSPVNGKTPIQPAVPTMAPTIVNSSSANGTPSQGDHSRKSSVTISAAGTSGFIPNGGPVANRAPSGLKFGAMSGSPAPAHAAPAQVPQDQQGAMQVPNPRVASPAHSPTPIPQFSGGKPSSTGLPDRPGLSFGGGSEGAEPNARTPSQPNANNLPQAQHLRRQSSQSAHSDSMGNNFNNNRPYQQNSGRGRGSFGPSYNPMGHSPQPFRPSPHQPRGNPASGFQPQVPPPGSPYRSPAMPPAQIHQQPQFAGQYYPPHTGYQPPVRTPSHMLNNFSFPPHQFSSSSSPSSPPPSSLGFANQSQFADNISFQQLPASRVDSPASVREPTFHPSAGQSDFLIPSQSPNFSFNQHYNSYLTVLNEQGMYGAPNTMDPYQQSFYPHQQYPMPMQGMQQSIYATSPSRGPAFPHMPPTYMGGYQQPQPQSMSRTPSNMSERPTSAVAQPSTPSMPHVSTHNPTPSVGSNSPAPASSFSLPPKKASKAIIIKNPDGEVLNFDKKSASPAPPKSPVVVATPTPPPRVPSATGSTHSRSESTITKTDDEKKAEFRRQVAENLAREEAEKKAAEEAETKAKEEAEKAAKEAEEKAAKEKEEAEAAEKAKADEEQKKLDAEAAKKKEEEEFERMIAEMEAQEKEEEERERAFKEKKAAEKAAEAGKLEEQRKKEDERLRKLEAEAEAREAAKGGQQDEEAAKLFAGLKKNTQFGPGATLGATDSGASTPTESAAPTPTQPKISAPKPKPANLKIDPSKAVEPAQPTPAMQSLKSARFLQVRNELINYPEGIKSPNPALNPSHKSKGRQYDKDFLLQFQDVFKEKPSVDWDMKLKETVGDSTDSARPPNSARPGGMSSRQASHKGVVPPSMGNFGASGGFRPSLPPNTTSEERFKMSNNRPMVNPLAAVIGGRPGGFPVPPQMVRNGSFQNVSGRAGSSGGRGSRRGKEGGSKTSKKEEAAMPLTAGMDIKALERSQTGWKPTAQSGAPAQPTTGHMAPDLVQRKVKAALNKMTPEKFDKISDQILEISAQSRDESDGRTLRQVIALTFEKACDESHWSSLYARFCQKMLATMPTDIRDETIKDKAGNPVVGGALFRKYLLNRCQEEFERGWEVNLPTKPEEAAQEAALLSDEYYIAAAAKRKGLGLIQFIGELYKLGMLTLRIMHECVLKLLDFEGEPDESAIESLVKLLRTVGFTMSQNAESGNKMIQVYFERIHKIIEMPGLNSRLKFSLMDLDDLRKAGWRDSKGDAKGPKTIAEIHQEAAAAQQAKEMERQRSNQRGGARPPVGRGDARSFSGNMPPPQDYPSGRVQMDDLRKLSKGASGRNINSSSSFGPSMLGSRSSSGRRGLGPGGMIGRGDESGGSSRTATPVQKEKESTTHMNSFSALAALENSEGAGEVGSPPSTASSPPVQKSAPAPAESKE